MLISGIPIPYVSGDTYHVEKISIEIVGASKIIGEYADVIMVDVKITNQYSETVIIRDDNTSIDDSKNRIHKVESYQSLKKQGFVVTSEQCPTNVTTDVNPHIPKEVTFCAIVPKDSSTYNVHTRSQSISSCGMMAYECSEMFSDTFKVESSSSSTKSPTTSSSTTTPSTQTSDEIVEIPIEQLESLLELFEKTNENHKEVLDQLKISIDEIERLNDEVEKLQ